MRAEVRQQEYIRMIKKSKNDIYPTVKSAINLLLENLPENGVIIESGTYLGNTSALMVYYLTGANKKFKLFTIDNFKFDNVSNMQKDVDHISDGYQNYLENIKDLGVADYITTIVSDSIEAISHFADKSVDFLFIDDVHGYGHVKTQLEKWLPKMVDGGIIFGDDYVDGVKQAFDEMFFGDGLTPCEGGCYIKI